MTVGRVDQAEVGEGGAGHDLGGDGGDRLADGLGDERRGAAGAGVDLEHEDSWVVRQRLLDSELNIHQSTNVQGKRHLAGLTFEFFDRLATEENGGIEQALSPEWTPASSMCSSTPATKTSLPSHRASMSTSVARER